MDSKADIAIVGGGLAGSLTALRFAKTHPELEIVLIEESDKLGGHHTWSFHESDVSSEALEWLQPLTCASWEETTVQFPRHTRTLKGRYFAIRSDDFHKAVTAALHDHPKAEVRFGMKATRISESHVEMANGDIVAARCVFDARGLDHLPSQNLNGYQKFIGLDFELEEPHGITHPILMDATCPQLDGFRFFYLLPLTDKQLLVEETYYSDTPDLNTERIHRSIRSYVERRGWKIAKQIREESGVLPIPLTSDYIKTSMGGEPMPLGLRGGNFHATTGYSLPDAVRIAEFFCKLEEVTTENARTAFIKFRRPWLSRQSFYRLLNRLLFRASEPSLRYVVFQQFYEQPQELVERFYAGRTTWGDRLRILSGRPPVPLERAWENFSEASVKSKFAAVNEAKIDVSETTVSTDAAPIEASSITSGAKSPSDLKESTSAAPGDSV